MKQRRLIHWKSVEDCKEYFKGVGYSGEALASRVNHGINRGNLFSEDRIANIKKKYDVNVIGGV